MTNWETCPICYGGDVDCPDNCGGSGGATTIGEHPPFSPAELAEIRRLAANEWTNIHRIKNETAVPSHRDKLTERLQTLERIEEKTR